MPKITPLILTSKKIICAKNILEDLLTHGGLKLRVLQKVVGKRSSITFSCLVTFSDAPVSFFITFCKTPSAGLLLWAQSLKIWAAANGGVTNGGLRGVWPPFPEIGRNRPFPPFFCLFRPFQEGLKSTWKIQKTEEKGLFPQISSDLLKPPSLKPPFAAPQKIFKISIGD